VEKVGQTIVFRGLLGWAFGPRNFMKNSGKPRGFPDVRSGFSTLSCPLDTRRCACKRPPGWGGGRRLKARTIAMVERGLGDRRQNPIVCPTLVRPECRNSRA
jgi:hypothetical protein